MIYNVYWLLFAGNFLLNIDHGSIPACFNEIQTQLDIGKTKFGYLGSMVYVGNAVGSMAAIPLMRFSSKIKWILASTIIATAFFLGLFAMTENFYIALVSRFCTGFL